MRRWRVSGTDLLARFAPPGSTRSASTATCSPRALDAQPGVALTGNLKPQQLRDALVRRRMYLCSSRWISLGLLHIEAMLLGLPVVVLDTTAAARTVPDAGAISPDPVTLVGAARRLLADPDKARAAGLVTREGCTSPARVAAVPRRPGPRVHRGRRRVGR